MPSVRRLRDTSDGQVEVREELSLWTGFWQGYRPEVSISCSVGERLIWQSGDSQCATEGTEVLQAHSRSEQSHR
jgi:hypothetical protein